MLSVSLFWWCLSWPGLDAGSGGGIDEPWVPSLLHLREVSAEDPTDQTADIDAYGDSLTRLATALTEGAEEAAQDAALDDYKAALKRLHTILDSDAERVALLEHGGIVVRWVQQRRRKRLPPRTWLVRPEGKSYLIVDPGGGPPRSSQDPVLDIWGADRRTPSSKNRPALKRPGDVILLAPGTYPTLKIAASYDVPRFQIDGKHPAAISAMVAGSDPITVIRAQRPGTVRLLPRRDVGGTSTCTVDWGGAIEFRDLILVADDRWTVGTEHPSSARWRGQHPGYRDLRFFGCDILGERDFETAEGPKNKWAVLTYDVGRSAIGEAGFVFAGTAERPARIRGIHKEHAFYLHNTHAEEADDPAVLLEHLDVKWCGRTFVQFTAREGEGPRGKGGVIIRHCRVEDVCMQPSGGGSAITLMGNHDGRFLIQDVRVHLGGNPQLHPEYENNITGAFVGHHGDGSEGRDTREVVIEDCHFEVGPHFVGKGSARRPNMMIAAITRFTMRGTKVWSHVGAREALRFDPATLQHVVLGQDNDVRGDVYWGEKRYVDRDEDGDGLPDGIAYRHFLLELQGEDVDGDGEALDPSPVEVVVD